MAENESMERRHVVVGMALILGCAVTSACAVQSGDETGESRKAPDREPIHIDTCPVGAICSTALADAGISWIEFNGTAFATAKVSPTAYPSVVNWWAGQWWVLETYEEPSPSGVAYYQIIDSAQWNGESPDPTVGGLCSGPAAAGATCAATVTTATIATESSCPICMMAPGPPTDGPCFD
jgi:hypothetical protein